uniref:Iron-binding zinc finger CDGSH type domain-containing protein n=1 Tax=Anser brachyrhynchus TaxID=132585 RepID=A0A8B9BL26_9AVES
AGADERGKRRSDSTYTFLRPLPKAPGPFEACSSSSNRLDLPQGQRCLWQPEGSRRVPFCDGSHRTAAPGVSPLRFTAEADGAAPLCACKRTRSPPYCDGSHREHRQQAAPPGPRP